MAAVLKKRALAEYSQVVQQDDSTARSLQLTKKPRQTVPEEAPAIATLDKCQTSGELLQALITLTRLLPTMPEDITSLVKKLHDLFAKEKDSAVRVKIVSLLGDICLQPKAEVQSVVTELLKLLEKEVSHKVRAEIILCLGKLGKLLARESPAFLKIIAAAKQSLVDTNHAVKSACLQVIGQLLPVGSAQAETLKLVSDYSLSQDPRVRTAAYQAMIDLHERGQKLELTKYREICAALDDDYESVRQAALRIIWILSQTYTESVLPVEDSRQEIRLVDDAFGKICRAITDLSVSVRTFAAELLGTMTNVSPGFLEQTLDKKLMSDMRRKRSAHQRHWETVTSGEWASGARWAEDAPRENIDADTVSLIHSGACGAFVHGLEDEFMEVRSAALDSLCQLALQNPTFARLSLDFLVDMFNDEIEEVRLKAIDCMTRISTMIILREDQLEIILGVLEDSNVEIREGLHRMLGACRLSTRSCLTMCVQNLLDNLKRYSQDKRSIWKCLRYLGSRHPELTLLLVPELLLIHPFFDMPEADVDDPAYVCVLLLVFNAAQHSPPMLSLLPEHTKRHYRYLRDTIPHLVPRLEIGDRSEFKPVVLGEANTRNFLKNVLGRVSNTNSSPHWLKIWETAHQDLIRLARIDPALAATADLLANQLQCHLLMAKIMNNPAWLDGSRLGSQEGGVVRNSIEQLQQQCLRLEYLFSNLSPEESLAVQTTRLQALALHLVYIVKASNTSALALTDHFVARFAALEKSIKENNLTPVAFAEAVIKELARLEDPKPGILARILLPILQDHVSLAPFRLPVKASRVTAEIFEPTGESDNPLKFLSGFLLGITMDAEILGLTDPENLRVRVKYPDQQVQLVVVKQSDLKLLSSADDVSENVEPDTQNADTVTRHRLRTTVLISHQVWTESCHVELGLVLNVSELELSSALKRWKTLPDDAFTVELCKPVKVLVSPKPIKRGI